METEICITEVEMEFFMQKRKQKRKCFFRWNRRGNRTFCLRKYEISDFTIGLWLFSFELALWLLCSPTTKQHTVTQ